MPGSRGQKGRQGLQPGGKLNAALYIRLSREDGDKAESFSITNQRLLLEEYINGHDDLCLYDIYVDDGYSGTNFQRPGFLRMLEDIESRKIQCVIVKDLSRLGRNMSKVSDYISEYFPRRKVRFIAVNDMVDRQYYDVDANGDMAVDFKNMFNGLYPRDIAGKVRSTFRAKQGKGQFIGAFASFGYVKSDIDHNRLEVDGYAAGIVKRVFEMYLGGMGQNTIAKVLNDEGIPCPSEYKRQCGLNYHNGCRLGSTSYWTYSTIRRMLQNKMYTGSMVQNKSFRQVCKKDAVALPQDKWIIVENTHEPIIEKDTWDKVQELLKRGIRQAGPAGHVHMFTGLLKCGDCGRAMVKVKRKGAASFYCGSYNRYGKKYCSAHGITEQELAGIVLKDLNLIIGSVKGLERLVLEESGKQDKRKESDILHNLENISKYQAEIRRLEQKKEHAYEDYSDGIITREEYLKHKGKYEQQEELARSKISLADRVAGGGPPLSNPWIENLLREGKLGLLDRETVVEMVSMIYIYEGSIKIVYNFSDELEALLKGRA